MFIVVYIGDVHPHQQQIRPTEYVREKRYDCPEFKELEISIERQLGMSCNRIPRVVTVVYCVPL